MRLIKTKPTEWQGNGFGTNNAEWVVKDADYISVRKFLSDWVAIDNNTGERIARAWTKKELLDILNQKLTTQN